MDHCGWEVTLLEMVNSFPYLGSNIANDGEITLDVASRIAKGSRAFGCLRKPIFQNSNLSVSTKRAVYRSVVLSVLFMEQRRGLSKRHV